MNNFFNVRAIAGMIVLEVYGVISEYDMFEEFLRWQILHIGSESSPLVVRMSSPGGDPRVAMSLYQIIKDHKGPTECYIEYMCDSAATLISCACDKVIGNKFPFEFMIHDPQIYPEWFGVEEGQAMVDFLSKTRDDMVRIYVEKTGQSEATIREWMKQTKFMNSDEALEFGFIDEIREVEQTLDAKVDYKIAASAHADQRPKDFKLEGRTSPENQPTKPIQAMNEWMKKLAAKVGLGDTADESDVVYSVTELKAKAEKADTLQADIEAKDTRISELEAENAQLKEKLPSEEEEQAAANAEVDAALEAAVKDFKINASAKEQLAAKYKGKPEELKATLELIPKDALKGSGKVENPKGKTRASAAGVDPKVAAYFN